MSAKTTKPLALESLDCRVVPATFGIPWHAPNHLSISFAPDGTPIASHASDLYAALGRTHSNDAWQREVLRAFQKWASQANLNFGFRPDEGQIFGTPGLLQHDPRFGDIRLGAHGMSADALAIAIPPDPSLAGTWSGDILLNSNFTFDSQPYSLLAVVLHEAGHALGLSNSSRADSVMYSLYDATRTTLSAEDISRIQALYGARHPDSFEGLTGNNTLTQASPFPLPTLFKGETPLVAFGDITTPTDVDFYSFRFPDDGNDDTNDREVTIRLQSSGVSLLAPRLVILDHRGQVLTQSSSSSYTGDVLQVKLTGLHSGQRYFVQVMPATQDEFAIGRYGLSVRLDKTSGTSDEVIARLLSGPFQGLDPDAIDTFFRNNGDVLLYPEEQTNDTPSQASDLKPAAGGAFEAIASLSKQEDVDVFRLVVPSGAGRILTATAWTPDINGFHPRLDILHASGKPVKAEILVNGNGTSTIQVVGVTESEVYYLRISQPVSASPDKGNYFVRASFGEQEVALTTFTEGSLHQAHRASSSRLYIGQTQLFHFVLQTGIADPGASIRLTIRDESGQIVYMLTARAGEVVSASSVLLRPGAHTVRFEVENPNGAPVLYRLRGASESDPIGPVSVDPTLSPRYTSPGTEGTQVVYIYPGLFVLYDPSLLTGYVNPSDSSTYPPGFVLPPEYADYPWLVVTANPYYWIALGL